MTARPDPIPEKHETLEVPLEGLRKATATILFRWEKLVGLAIEFLAEYHQRAVSDSTINSFSRPQAHTLGCWSSTLEPATNHDDAMFDETHPTGYWQDGQTVRVQNWPERRSEPSEGFNLRQFFGEQ
jgi:hypothetical protein